MASAHCRSGVRGLPPPNRWVFLCFGIKRCSSVHNSSDTRKLVVTLFTGARWRRFLVCAINTLYQILVIRIGTKLRAQEALRESETYYRLLFEQHPTPIW